MENLTEKAYKEIFKVLNKHKELINFDLDNLKSISEYHLFGVELKEKYGLNIDTKKVNSLSWTRVNDYITIGWWDKKYSRTISWSDNGEQPTDELLLCISFSTGAYIFGDDYPVSLFQKLFLELQSFKPKYTDNHNHSLYFSMDNAKDVFNSFDSILKKYHELNKEDYKKRKIEKMKEDLDKLQNA